ncbi:MAG: P-II family nitrogen regulator [Candidatus Brocadiales bacterium]
MKKVEAIIRVGKLNAVKAALEEIKHPGLTVTNVRGHGVQKGITETWRGKSIKIDLLDKVKIEIVSPDKDVSKIIAAIVEEGKTGNVGDGKIFVSTVDEVVRIRTGEKGEKAVS